jgi:hypothetical protein
MTVKNIKEAIKYACGTPQGKHELSKQSFRDKNGNVVWKNPAMTIALVLATADIPNRYVEEQNKLQYDNKELFCKKVKRVKQTHLHPKEEYTWLKKRK